MQDVERRDDILCQQGQGRGSDRLPPIEASLRTRCGATTRTWFTRPQVDSGGLCLTLAPGWPETFSTLEP